MSKDAMMDLMTRLSRDRKQSQEFRDDPDRIMAGLDLTEEEREMLKRGRREEIREYLGGTRDWEDAPFPGDGQP